MTPLWSTELPHSLTGSMQPMLDPTRAQLLVSDGWGTAFAALSLRCLSLSDGTEVGTARLRNPPHAVAMTGSEATILVSAGKRLFELERGTLRELRRWEKGVAPQPAHHVLRVGDLALLMTRKGPTAGLFNLEEGACRRKRFGSCQGLYQLDAKRILVCSGVEGVVTSYDTVTGKSATIATPGPFMHAAYADGARLLVLGLGAPYTVDGASETRNRISSHLWMLRMESGEPAQVLAPPSAVSWLSVSPGGEHLVLADGRTVHVCTWDGEALNVVEELELPAPFEPAVVDFDRKRLVGVDTEAERGVVSVWELRLPRRVSSGRR